MSKKWISIFFLLPLAFQLFGQSLSVTQITDSLKELKMGRDSVVVRSLLDSSYAYLNQTDIEQEANRGKLCLGLGDFYSENFQYDSSMKYFQQAVDIFEQQTDTTQLAKSYYKLGGVYADIEDYPYSAEIYLKALDLYTAIESEYDRGKTFNALANNYYYYGDTDVALSYYQKAIDIFEKRKDTLDLSMSLGNVAATFMVKEEYDTSKIIYERAIKLVKYTEHNDIHIGNLIGMGIALEESGEVDEAYYYYKRAYLEAQRTDNFFQIGFCYQNFAYYFLAKNITDSAEHYAQLALETSGKMNNQQLRSNALEILHQVYYKKGQFKKAYDVQKIARTEIDSLYDLTSQRQLEAVHAQYEISQKEEKLDQANLQLKLNENILERQIIVRNALIAVLFLMIVSISLVYRSQKLRTKANKMLKQKNEEIDQKRKEIIEIEDAKSRWFVNISHELRTPLTLVKGPIDQLSNQKNLDDNIRKGVQIASRNVKLLENLVDEILDISKIEDGNIELETEIIDISDMVRQMALSFEAAARMAQIDLKFEYPLGTPLYLTLDRNKIIKAISNLIANAIKHTPEGGNVRVRLQENAEDVIIQVIDSGEGIHSADLPFIFDRFYQAKFGSKSNLSGSGVGLSLSKEIAKLHGGDIRVDSKIHKGSTFELLLPTTLKIHLDKNIQKKDPVAEEEEPFDIKLNPSDKKVLLVDDNADMREYVIGILSEFFEVRQARDGKEALDLLRKSKPDLIITDIMMPRMDGITFTKKVKEKDSLKNVPIITLTALADEKVKVDTLRTGVDDYIVKPFNSEELLIRIQNLIHNSEERIQESEVDDTSYDEKLIKKLEEEVLANISDADFSVNRLAEAGDFSERQLYRYIKSTTGLTPANFVKEIRLQKAMELAMKKKYPTTVELSHAVGFQHSSYFINVFKKRFGKSPSSILKDQ